MSNIAVIRFCPIGGLITDTFHGIPDAIGYLSGLGPVVSTDVLFKLIERIESIVEDMPADSDCKQIRMALEAVHSNTRQLRHSLELFKELDQFVP